MTQNMFCFQCEQTAGGRGCTGCAGVCGKKADTAQLQDDLTGALVTLAQHAKATNQQNRVIDQLILDGLFTTLTNVNFNDETIQKLRQRIHAETLAIGGNIQDYDLQRIWTAEEDIRSLKSLILFGIRGVAAYAYHAEVLGYHSDKAAAFFYKKAGAFAPVLSVGPMCHECAVGSSATCRRATSSVSALRRHCWATRRSSFSMSRPLVLTRHR